MGDHSGMVLRRRPKDSGVSLGGNSLESGEDLEKVSTEDDVFTSKVTDSPKNLQNTAGGPKAGAMLAIKERWLTTANQIAIGGKYFAVAFIVWIVGLLGFSFLWLVIGVFAFTWRKYKQERKTSDALVLNNIADDEKKYFQTVKDIYKMSGKDLPSWVYFPDVEKAEWLNKILEQLWPRVGDFVKNIIIEKVEPAICQSNKLLKGLTFSKLDLGEKSPRIAGVKVYGNGQTRRTEIVMDLQLIYQSDSNIRVTVNGLSAGIKNLSIRGLIRVELGPLISSIPLVGAVAVSFVHQPTIDFDLTDFGNFLELPGIDELLHSAVSDCVFSMMVLPERYVLKLADDVDISRLLHPLPKGVVRIDIIEAQNLEEKDRKIFGVGGGSDPYVEVKVGRDHEFRTKTVEHDVNPVWNERFDVFVMEAHSSSIEITLYDDDGALTKADYLGSASVQMASVYNEGLIDEWIQLSNVKRGKIHVKIEWLDLSQDLGCLTEAMELAGKHNLNSAFVSIYIDSAKDLPLKSAINTGSLVVDQVQDFFEGKYEPSPLVKIVIPGHTKPFKTKVACNTNNPVWEESFRAMIGNPRMESLDFTIQDNEDVLGSLRIKIYQLLKAPNMTMEEPFNLTDSGSKSRLQMRLTARLLLPKGLRNRTGLTKGKKSSFVVTESKTSAEPPILNSETKSVNDIPDIGGDMLTASEENGSTGRDFPRKSSETLPDATSVDLRINFVDKNLARFVANSPAISGKLRSNVAKSNRSESFTSELSSVSEDQDLRDRSSGVGSNGSGGDFPLGRLNLALRYSPQRQKLFIEVIKAEKLIICDEDNNTSDPYVRMYLLPNRRGSQRRKTKVVKNSINPFFNETFEYDVMKGELYERQVEISVKNKTGLLSSEKVLMGQIFIDLADYDLEQPVTEWFPLQIRTDKFD